MAPNITEWKSEQVADKAPALHFVLLLLVWHVEELCYCRCDCMHKICYVGDETLLWIGFDMTAYSVVESDEEISVCVSAYGGVGTEVFGVYIYPQDVTTQGICILLWCTCTIWGCSRIGDTDLRRRNAYLDPPFPAGAADYVIPPWYWRLSVVNGTQCIIIGITNDTEGEETEYFQMFLSGYSHISGNYGRYRYFNTTVTLSIFDDDGEY